MFTNHDTASRPHLPLGGYPLPWLFGTRSGLPRSWWTKKRTLGRRRNAALAYARMPAKLARAFMARDGSPMGARRPNAKAWSLRPELPRVAIDGRGTMSADTTVLVKAAMARPV